MTTGNWIALVLPVFGLIGGAIVYQVQKTIDRNNQLKAERRQLYREFVSTFNTFNAAVLQRKKEEALAAFLELHGYEAEILVCAPDHVIESLKAFSSMLAKYASSQFTESDEKKVTYKLMLDAHDAVIEQMRIDVLGKTKVTAQAVSEFALGLAASLGRLPF